MATRIKNAGRRASRVLVNVMVTAITSVSLLMVSCDGLDTDMRARVAPDDITEDTIVPGYAVERSLNHQWDSVYKTSVTDDMTAPLTVWRTENGQKTAKLYENTARPRLTVTSSLLRDDYNITKDQLDIVPMDYQLRRATGNEDGASLELDTCVWSFIDAQVFTVPVKITNHSVEVAGTTYYHGSLTLMSAEFVRLVNTERGATRALYVSANYDTEYLAKLLFREKNVSNPQTFTVYVHQYALRHLLEDDAVKERKVENKDRVVVDATTERCSFDIVSIYKSGETTREAHQIILNRLFKGIAEYNKNVDNFNYSFVNANGVKVGTASQARTEDKWTVQGRTDGYGANLRNNVAADNVTTVYTFYHEAANYKDGDLNVEFGFEPVNVTEVNTKVTSTNSDRDGFDKGVLSNEIGTTYIGYSQNLDEKVNLYKTTTVTGYEIREPKIVVTRGKVTTSLTWITKYSNGKEETETVSKDFARNFQVLTNWDVYSTNSNQTTDTAVVKLASTENKVDGEWSYAVETRIINTTAKLAGSAETNGWRSIDPNRIKFTRNGKSHDFGTLAFAAKEVGASVAKKSESANEVVYGYTDKITVKYADNSFDAEAPGTIRVKNVVVSSYDIRDTKMVVLRDKVVASLKFITKYSDGHEDVEDTSMEFARSFQTLTNWNAYSANADQTTGAAIVTMARTEDRVIGNWSFTYEIRNINTTANLASGTQSNGWESIDPNHIVYTKNGKTYDFGTIAFTATETGATVSKAGEDQFDNIFSYTDNITVSFAEDSFNASAPGTIRVEKPWTPDFPAEWGKFTGCGITTARNEAKNSWVYVLSVHFQNGTCPLIVRNNFAAPEVNLSYFENDTNGALNSASWVASWGKWANTVAQNKSGSMTWTRSDGTGADAYSYTGATAINWDYGYTEGGHPSVYTDKFTAAITRDGSLLTIYKDGNVFAQYKAVR